MVVKDVRVSKILVHPIKSCRGTSVQSAKYTPEGIEFDRQWCIIDTSTQRILTAREMPKMVLIVPHIERDPSSAWGGVLTVTFPSDPDCEPFSVPLTPTDDILRRWTMISEFILWPTHDPLDGFICESVEPSSVDSPSRILSKHLGKSVHLMYKGPRSRPIDPTTTFPDLKATAVYQDMYPILILSEESMEQVNEKLQVHVGKQGIEESWRSNKVTIERFRPNIVLIGGGPFVEDQWKEVTIGSEGGPNLTLVSKCARCLLPNVCPETGERDKAVPYKVLTKFRTGLDEANKLAPCVGCNAVPAGCGVVNVGDLVYVKKVIV
ncbi:hypothetical protein AMATHDRAFT_147151 [Amanita thiersii Skay4041]|uniref:MOSC domain-containing protein n=1 Tax=Amanita thiersii Skay4041 TaxID=703135 RepID=A0A2A9NHX1_9AGAR|nr:hypothetical protein AMATHDRAFT_147151 [Amanita thiersii Skay4041]